MIVTLTANPSLDRTVTLDGPLMPGEVQGARNAREDAGVASARRDGVAHHRRA